MKLVIVESPSKAKTINKYLGKDYIVKASKGHVVDLPKSKLGIDIENGFAPDYQVTNNKSLQEIKKSFKDAESLILAVDLDREGEAIGWHIAKELNLIDNNGKPKGKKNIQRIVFSEITKEAINEAIKSPREIDINLVNAQQARRILDRLVGYKLSPLLWKKIQYGLSAGRVQSVALRLVVEREEERNKFKPEEYWSVEADLTKTQKKQNPKIVFKEVDNKNSADSNVKKEEIKSIGTLFALSKIDGKTVKIKSREDAESITEIIAGKSIQVEKVQEDLSSQNPRPPFITSTLQQAGVNVLGFSAKKTMQVAQKLYESGYITYMRTDSLNMSNIAITSGEKYIKEVYGSKYLPESRRYYKNKNKNAQEAHECIRPVDFFSNSTKLSLEGDEKKVYDLVWKRALSSIMASARVKNVSVTAKVQKYELKATGSQIVFDGYLKVYPEKIGNKILPDFKEEEKLYPDSIEAKQHFTEPPARYSEASLIKKMELLGIGRPSTYATIISTIISRKYVESVNKYLRPTDVGVVVNKLLTKYFMDIVDYDFTRTMEENLDNVAEGKIQWQELLGSFYKPFEKNILEKEKTIARSEFTELGTSEEKCTECGSKMVIKLGKYGKFLSCSRYPECKGMKTLEEEDSNQNGIADVMEKGFYQAPPKAEDGRLYLLKKGRYGSFWAHPDYPKVKDAKPLVLTKEGLLSKYGEIPQTEDGREFLLKKGKFGEFWAHPDYPEVKEIRRIKKTKK